MSQGFLAAEGLVKSFEATAVLRGLDLDVAAGEVHALAGENGAGKSTLVRILAGLIQPDAGRLLLDGRVLRLQSPADAAAAGIAIVHQDFDLVPHMSVAENLSLGAEPARFGFIDRRTERRRALACLEAAHVRLDPDARVAQLSVAQRQLLAIARAVTARCRVLVLDEPTSALGADDVALLLSTIGSLQARGVAVLLITHRLEEMFAVAGRISVLRDGRRVACRAPAQSSAAEIARLMVGRDIPARRARHVPRPSDPCLELRGLQAAGLRSPISLAVARGEILGLYGLRGAGRTALLRAIFGLEPCSAGEIRLHGALLRARTPAAIMARGMGWVCRDRKGQGVVSTMTVGENLTLAALGRLSRAGLLDRPREAQEIAAQIRELGIRPGDAGASITTLSGGNQQKVMLARWLVCRPVFLALDEPTAGVDVGAKADIHDTIQSLVAGGLSVLFVSSELPDVLALSDRIAVMHDGELRGCLDREQATEERIMQMIYSPSLKASPPARA